MKQTLPIRIVEKLYENRFVSLRDYEVEKYKDTGVIVVYRGETMKLTPEELKSEKLQIHERVFQSKYNKGQTYKLIDFLFNPRKDEK